MVERCLHTAEAVGSIPTSPTMSFPLKLTAFIRRSVLTFLLLSPIALRSRIWLRILVQKVYRFEYEGAQDFFMIKVVEVSLIACHKNIRFVIDCR